MDVLHVITTLEAGGAERLLVNLVGATDPSAVRHRVLVLAGRGPLAAPLAALGVPVYALGLPRIPGVAALRGAVRSLVGAGSVDLVHTWMIHSNALGGLPARGAGVPVVWSLHHSDLDPATTSRRTLAIERGNARLAWRVADAVVSTSRAAVDLHIARGYPRDAVCVIPNGVRVPEDPPGLAERARWRRQLDLPADAPLVGLVARFHPQKDHLTALRAFSSVRTRVPEARLVLVGGGSAQGEEAVRRAIGELGVADAVRWLGPRDDSADLVVAFDVCLSSSAYGETSSLALSESLAAGVPVVATAVGDAPDLQAAGGRVVPARDDEALAQALTLALTSSPQERQELARQGHAWVRAHRSTEVMAQQYTRLYQRVVAARRRGMRYPD